MLCVQNINFNSINYIKVFIYDTGSVEPILRPLPGWSGVINRVVYYDICCVISVSICMDTCSYCIILKSRLMVTLLNTD